MNTDLYTKTVLTVIALCLVWMCANGATPVARAQGGTQPSPVVLVDEKGVPINTQQGLRVRLVNEQGVPIYTPQGLRVNLGAQPQPVIVNNVPLPVSVRSIQQTAAWDPVFVRVLREPPTLAPTP
jgi:hypothetical protein